MDGEYLMVEKRYRKTFEGSPMSEGIFQFDMWNVKPSARDNWKSCEQVL